MRKMALSAGILVMVLVFGIMVVGCFTTGETGPRRETEPRTTGGSASIRNTSDSNSYWWARLNNIGTAYTIDLHPLGPGGSKFAGSLREDGEFTIYYRILRDGERTGPTPNEDPTSWNKKTVYVSGNQRFEIDIP